MQWEYYRLATVESCLDEALQELGLDGWELVSIMSETRLFHGFQCLLKRPVNSDSERGKSPALPPRYQKLLSVR